MQKAQELLNNLQQFTGTTQWFKHPLFPKFRYTDGIKYLAVNAECYWLLEFIFGYQTDAKIKATPFQVWKIVKKEDRAIITIEDGNSNVVRTFKLKYTSFPLKEYSIWMIDGVLLLKSEY